MHCHFNGKWCWFLIQLAVRNVWRMLDIFLTIPSFGSNDGRLEPKSLLAADYCGRSAWISSHLHYDDVIMSEIASQITSHTIVYSTVLSGADQSKHQSSASLAFVWEIHRWPVNFPHKWPVTRKIFPFDDVIMIHHSLPQITQPLRDYPSYRLQALILSDPSWWSPVLGERWLAVLASWGVVSSFW